jgi:polygalacturonase
METKVTVEDVSQNVTVTVSNERGPAGPSGVVESVEVSDITPVSSGKLIGRHGGGSGDAQEVGLDGGLEFHGGNIRREALTGDVTATAGSNATTIAADAVGNTKLANMAEATIKGRASGTGTGDPQDLTAAQVQAIAVTPAALVTAAEGMTSGQESAFRGAVDGARDGPIAYIANFSPDLTGATSASQAIQNAINSLPVGGGTVIAPPGATLLCRDIRLRSNIRFVGEGCTFRIGGASPAGAPVDPENSQLGALIYAFGIPAEKISNISVIGGTYIGSRTNYVGIDGEDLIQVTWATNVVFQGVTLLDVGQDGIELKSCENVTIKDSTLRRIRDGAIEIRGCSAVEIYNNIFDTVANAVFVKSHESSYGGSFHTSGLRIFRNQISYFGGESGLGAFGMNWPNDCLIEDNNITTTIAGAYNGGTFPAIAFGSHPVNPSPSAMQDVYIRRNRISGLTTASPIRILCPTGSTSRNILIEANVCIGGSFGIHTEAQVTILDNEIRSAGTAIRSRAYGVTRLAGNASALGVELLDGPSPAKILFESNTVANVWCNSGSNVYSIVDNTTNDIILEPGNNGSTVSGNTINGRFVSQGNEIVFSRNSISYSGGVMAVRILGDRCRVESNYLTGSPAIVIHVIAPSSHTRISENNIVNTGSSTSLRMEGSFSTISNNYIRGGNQNIRVTGDRNSIIGNWLHLANFQGIDLQSGADSNLVSLNTIQTPGTTAIQDAGAGNTLLNNVNF